VRGRDLLSISDLTPEELGLVLKTARGLKDSLRAIRGVPSKVRRDTSRRLGPVEAEEEPRERREEGGHLFGQDLWPSLRNRAAARERGAAGEAEAAPRSFDKAQDEREDEREGGAEDSETLRQPQGEREEGELQREAAEAAARVLTEAPREQLPRPLAGKTLALVFEKPSLRTRVSFDVGMRQLGGECVYISPAEVGLNRREPVEDVARVLGRYADCIAARTFSHETVEALAKWAEVPVINALSDTEHPCQALADFQTILEQKGRLRGVKLAYIGDGNNVARSLCLGAAMLGMDFRIASPRGFELDQGTLSGSRVLGGAVGGSIAQTHDPREAASGADVVYTDVWASMGQEEEAAARAKAFAGYEVNMELMAVAKGDAIFMHDLPAHRGEEVSAEVMEGAASVVWEQAENRMHAQKAVLSLILGGEA
jgi:ornithine carbamoyltransferase